jgi:non-specific serine/threonine protein kinase
MIYAIRGGNYMATTVVNPVVNFEECRRDAEEALQLARSFESKPNEAAALGYFAMMLGVHGFYAQALAFGEQGLAIAEAIEQPVWRFVNHQALGALYSDLLEFTRAQQHLERALEFARNVNALELMYAASAFLAPVYLAQGDLHRAVALLDEMAASDVEKFATTMQRRLETARVELYLAQGSATEALALLDRIIAATPHAAPLEVGESNLAYVIPVLWRLRGTALAALGRWAEADRSLHVALEAAQLHGYYLQLWRIQITHGALLRSMRKAQLSAATFDQARATIRQLAQEIPEEEGLRQRFLAAALALTQDKSLTPAQQAAREAGGLTSRERAIAALIAKGKNNREIAEMLVLSQRTVETHVSNIMNKLDITTRSQIAVWAAERGL